MKFTSYGTTFEINGERLQLDGEVSFSSTSFDARRMQEEADRRQKQFEKNFDAIYWGDRPAGQGPVTQHHGPMPSNVLYPEFTSRSGT